jgi:hypothetical protein
MTWRYRGQTFNPLVQVALGVIALGFALAATTIIDHQVAPPPPRVVPMVDDRHPTGMHTAHAM